MTEDIPYTHRFVATSHTGKKIARAFLGRAHRMKRQWVVYSLFLVIFASIAISGMSESFSLWSRIFWAIVFALVPTLITVVLVVAISYFQMVRGTRVRLFNGAVLESGFGEDEMVIRNPIASGRMAYKGIKSVSVRGDFVFMKHHGLPLVVGYPRELFPDEAINRILRAQRRAGRASKWTDRPS